MKRYDVIIVGAGIAGCGLAYNLKQAGYKGSVLIIDKTSPGAAKGHGIRTTFKSDIQEYNLPYIHIFNNIKMGIEEKIHCTLQENMYCLDYKKVCNHLIKNSGSTFRKEKALDIKSRTLKTSNGIYSFNYLIDCSGTDFFLAKIMKRPAPFKYWKGINRVLENKTNLSKNNFYYMFGQDGRFEEVYVLGDKILQSDWFYTGKQKFKPKEPTAPTFKKSHLANCPIREEKTTHFPVSPVLPLQYNNRLALLGDSFGNAPPISGFGINKILETSQILAKAITKKNLKLYEKEWKRQNMSYFLKHLTDKMDRYNSKGLVNRIKKYPSPLQVMKTFMKYPEVFMDLCHNNKNFKPPTEIIQMFPRRRIIFYLLTSFYLRLKYWLMQIQAYL